MTGNRDGVGNVPPSGMTIHPDADLASYADLGPAPERAAALVAHLAACPRCSRRVDELRAVRRLLAAAPPPRPSRSLLPPLARVPLWLRPARALATLGAGTFLFLFLASAVLHSGSDLGGGTTAAERAAARGQLSVPAASAAAAQDAATSAAKAVPAAGSSGRVFGSGAPAPAGPIPARREFGPPPWTFALLTLVCGALALGIHRRLRRS